MSGVTHPHSSSDTARWRSGATETEPCWVFFFFFFTPFSGKHQWGECICMSGRLCQWAHWEGWVSGWSRGKQPSKCTVNNQSIRDYYRFTNFTEIYLESLLWTCFFFFLIIWNRVLCACVRMRVQRPGWFCGSTSPPYIAPRSADEEDFVTFNTLRSVFLCVTRLLPRGPGFTQRRSGEPIIRRSLGWVHWISRSNLASTFADTSRVIWTPGKCLHNEWIGGLGALGPLVIRLNAWLASYRVILMFGHNCSAFGLWISPAGPICVKWMKCGSPSLW